MPGVEYRLGEVDLEVNDKFVLYTDGVDEAVNSEGELYGTRRFIDFFLKESDLSAREECAAILKDVMDFQEDNRHDAITLTIFQRLK